MVTLKTFTILLPVSKGGLLVEMNCSYQLRKEIMANVFFHSCSYVLPSCFLFFFVTLLGPQLFRSFCCLRFRFSTFSLFTTVILRCSLPFSVKSIQRTLLNSMSNHQNLVNNNFEANMDLQHGRSDKVVSRSPQSTQIC